MDIDKELVGVRVAANDGDSHALRVLGCAYLYPQRPSALLESAIRTWKVQNNDQETREGIGTERMDA